MGNYSSKSDEQKRQEMRRLAQIGYDKHQRKSELILSYGEKFALSQCRTTDPNQVFKSTRPNTFDFNNVGVPRHSNKGISKEEDRSEYFDELEKIEEQVKVLVEMIKGAKNVVVYTGAGISVTAGLPDFRGTHGVWTQEEKDFKAKEDIKDIPSLSEIVPTYAHMAIAKLMEMDMVKAVITTNMDNLHRRSGVPNEKLIELHGCSFVERCTVCGQEYLREKEAYYSEIMKCEKQDCTGTPVDTIVNFNEPIYPLNWSRAVEISKQCDLAIVLGTSLRVLPSCLLPEMGMETLIDQHKMVICNLQITPYDDNSKIRFFCPTDDMFYYLMKALNLETPLVTPKGEKLREQPFPTQPKSYHVPSKNLNPNVYDVNFRFLF